MFGLQRNRAFETAKKLSLALLSEKGEANARSMAVKCLQHFETLEPADQLQLFGFWAQDLSPDAVQVMEAARRYLEQGDEESQIDLCRKVEPPRQELFRRLNRAAGGVHTLVRMRERLLLHLKQHPRLRVVDSDMQHLFNSWFNPGFLEVHEITWASPARLLEKIIQHESVHAIDGWDDLRRRLQPDRRCFAFFHPQLPDEPLIFVEVALLPTIPREVGPLLDKRSEPLEPKKFKCAIFYSISNCQPGLRGVSLGNFLIKRVAERIQDEIPSVKTFCTLSPIPGFTQWLDSGAVSDGYGLAPAQARRLAAARETVVRGPWREQLAKAWRPDDVGEEQRKAWQALCFAYLAYGTHHPGRDPVARFHLANGAILHNINWAADISRKGLAQSAGMMVNYLYELDAVEENHEAFVNRQVVYARSLTRLL